jgi:non-specific serine/threonine protein kinase
MIGKTVSHYRILEKLGEGGMGVVYKADDTKLKRTVALKFLRSEAIGGEEERTRFIHEAQAAAAVEHPSICTVYEIDRANDQTFISMAYIDGSSLRERIEPGPVDVDEALRIAIQVAEGLQKAHEKGIIHRDIKSGNIMVASGGQAKLTDFGLAKLAMGTKVTKTGTTVGTAAYMSPEQARGDAIDHTTDMWSLGVVLYEMLAGQLPFKGDYEQAVLYSVLNEQPEPLSRVRPEVTPGIEDIVKKALQKDSADRYPDLSTMLEDLRKAKEGSEVKVALPRAPGILRRRTQLAVAIGVVAIAAVGVLMWPTLKQKLGVGRVEAKTLAVVDFDNIGTEEANHLTGGLAEGISVKLSKLAGIRVVNNDDVRRLRKNELSAKDVATRLGASYAVGGSLLRAGEKIRVTPQLIEASTGDVIWSELFDREFTDVFEFLDEVSVKIVSALKVELSPSDELTLHQRSTDSPEAYEHYLKGKEFFHRTTVRDNELSEREFQRALKFDQEYPLALAGLADAYVQRYKERFDYDEYWLDEADGLIDGALELDPGLAEAYESRAELLIEKENHLGALQAAEKAKELRPDWDEPYLRLGEIYQRRGEGSLALEMFDKALGIRSSVEGWCGRGGVLGTRGLVDSAEVAFRQAAEHNPDHDRPLHELGWMYRDLDNLEESERMFRRAIEVRPDRGRSYQGLMWLLLWEKSRVQEAEKLIRDFADEYPYHRDAYEALFELLAWELGDWPAALEVIEKAASRNPGRVWPHLLLAEAYAWQLGERPEPEKAVAAVQRALELRPKSGRALHQAGNIYRDLDDTETALYYYRVALKNAPGSPRILADMANLLIGQARFDSAAVVAAEGIRQSPGVVQARGWDNYKLLEIALTHLMREDEYLRVLQDAADRHGRDNPFFYVKLGWEQCLSGKCQEAMRSYNRVLDMRGEGSTISPDLTNLSLRGLGMAQWLSGDTEGAQTSFTEAAGADGLASYTFGRPLIFLLKYLGRFDEIDQRLESMREEGRLDDWAWAGIYYYPDMRRFDDALNMVSEVLESGEVTWKMDLEFQTAVWHLQKGDMKNAKRVLREIEPSLPFGYKGSCDLTWAVIETTRGNLGRAVQFAERAYSRDVAYRYTRNHLLMFLSALYLARGQTEEALSMLDRVNGYFDSFAPFYRRAQLLIVTQSPDADWELRRVQLLATRYSRSGADRSSPGMARAYSALASARLGDYRKARKEIEYAVKLEPELADIAYHAACAYALVGDVDKALEWLETAIDRGHQELWWARVDPDLDNLRELPRFKKIIDGWDRRMRALFE